MQYRYFERWNFTDSGQAGEIVEVRFPSLKYNTHRRFCYVQFKSADQAVAATKLNNNVVGDGLNLQVKISDPSARQDRQEPMYEEREIHISNIHFDARENDLKEIFSKYGNIETVRIPSKVSGEHRGFGFIVFSTKVRERTCCILIVTFG